MHVNILDLNVKISKKKSLRRKQTHPLSPATLDNSKQRFPRDIIFVSKSLIRFVVVYRSQLQSLCVCPHLPSIALAMEDPTTPPVLPSGELTVPEPENGVEFKVPSGPPQGTTTQAPVQVAQILPDAPPQQIPQYVVGGPPDTMTQLETQFQSISMAMPPSSNSNSDTVAVVDQTKHTTIQPQQPPSQRTSTTDVTDNDEETQGTDEDPLKLFVGQVPKTLGEEDIFTIFEPFGPLKDLAIIRDKHTGLHRGCAFVTYWSSQDAERAQASLHDSFTFPGGRRPAQVKPAEPSGKLYYTIALAPPETLQVRT